MNPVRLWTLIQQGALGVIERYFGPKKPKGSLITQVTAHLAPSGSIRQDELSELTGIVKQGLSTAKQVQAGQAPGIESLPRIPANIPYPQVRYRIATNVEGGGVSKRITPEILSDTTLSKRELFNEIAGQLRGEYGKNWYDKVVAQLLQQQATVITPQVIISAYMEIPLQEYE
jgi:hypothetical protein